MKRALILAGVLVSTAVVAAPNPSPDLAREIAEKVVPLDGMRGLVMATVVRTTTGAIIAKRVGAVKAVALLQGASARSVERHGDEWKALLADSYREALNESELKALSGAIQKGDKAAMTPFMDRAGAAMQAKATPLLQRAATEALGEAYDQAMKEPAQ